MTKRITGYFTAALCAALFIATPAAFADDHGHKEGHSDEGGEHAEMKKGEEGAHEDAAAHAYEMSAEEKAAYEAWMAVATPGPEHHEMAGMVGSWTGTMKMKMSPEQPGWMESEFTSEITSTLDGRYFEENFNSSMDGMPFQGRSFTGFDRAKGEYVTLWMDNMGTAPSVMRGKMEGDDELVQMGSMYDVSAGGDVMMKGVTTFSDDDTHTYSMYWATPDGGWWKGLEINYQRVK